MTDYLEHFGVKGMKWGVRKQAGAIANKTINNTDYRIALGSRLVASFLITHGAIKIGTYAGKQVEFKINKGLNWLERDRPIEERKLRPTSRYYDRKIKDWVYSYN